MKTIKKQLIELGFSGGGFDEIKISRDEFQKRTGIDLESWTEIGNEFGGCDYTIWEEDENQLEYQITIEILDGMIHDVIF